uniref:Uncharacterized protein n=1 Tax=Arundo donax TaxID=35708 RepID=A0A0A8YH80_ARUDO
MIHLQCKRTFEHILFHSICSKAHFMSLVHRLHINKPGPQKISCAFT